MIQISYQYACLIAANFWFWTNVSIGYVWFSISDP